MKLPSKIKFTDKKTLESFNELSKKETKIQEWIDHKTYERKFNY